MSSVVSDSQPGWTGLTIKEILERVNLFNVTSVVDEEGAAMSKAKANTVQQQNTVTDLMGALMGGGGGGQQDQVAMEPKESKLVLDASDPSTAFLGPKLWDNPITLPHNESSSSSPPNVITASANVADYSVMDLEDFLQENDLDLDEEEEEEEEEESKQPVINTGGHRIIEEFQEEEEDAPPSKKPKKTDGRTERNCLPKAENTFLYAESKRARAEREKAERKRRKQMEAEERALELQEEVEVTAQVQFAPEDLALATIPGMDFDPRKRAFSVDELKPQPIIKKRKKNYVDLDAKDPKYWAKREKNNIAARRSREARRLKENQIALRAAFLEKENSALRGKLKEAKASREALAREAEALRQQLRRYEDKN